MIHTFEHTAHPTFYPVEMKAFLPKKGRREIAGRLDRLEDTAKEGQNGPGNAYTTGQPADIVLTETDYAILDECSGDRAASPSRNWRRDFIFAQQERKRTPDMVY